MGREGLAHARAGGGEGRRGNGAKAAGRLQQKLQARRTMGLAFGFDKVYYFVESQNRAGPIYWL